MKNSQWIHFVPKGKRILLQEESVEGQKKVECILTDYEGKMQVFFGEIEAGAGVAEEDYKQHGGEEFAYLIKGSLDYYLGKEKYSLHPGDTICFTSSLPHRYFNPGPGTALVLWGEIDEKGEIEQ